jgi:hypothetical protein
MIASVQSDQPPTTHVMSVAKFERFFRFAASLSVEKQDLKRYCDFINQKIFDLMLRGEAAAKANPWFKRGTVYGRAVNALRTAEQPLTAREIAERVLATANIKRPDKAALADLIGTINSSLRNHVGKGVHRTNEGTPARWRLRESAHQSLVRA